MATVDKIEVRLRAIFWPFARGLTIRQRVVRGLALILTLYLLFLAFTYVAGEPAEAQTWDGGGVSGSLQPAQGYCCVGGQIMTAQQAATYGKYCCLNGYLATQQEWEGDPADPKAPSSWVGDLQPAEGPEAIYFTGADDMCATGRAKWQAKSKVSTLNLFWGKVTTRVCAKKDNGNQWTRATDVYAGVNGFGNDVGWRYDGVVDAGYKVMSPFDPTGKDAMLTAVWRTLHWTQCASGISLVLGCLQLRTRQVKFTNTFASWPGKIQAYSYPND